MALVDSVADWAQVALNAGALVVGGAVWKLYFENLKATISTREAEVGLVNERVTFWREKAEQLEKRSPEVVERVLQERIAIRESEIVRLTDDKGYSAQELRRVQEEVKVMQRTLDQTTGFREMLALDEPDPNDPEYQKYMEFLEANPGFDEADGVVELEVVHLGNVGVDSGQLMITDPCYIDSEWSEEEFQDDRVYRDSQTQTVIKWGKDFERFDQPLDTYGETPAALIESGRLVQVPPPPLPDKFTYSYNGACQASLGQGHGELVYRLGHPGAGVVFATAYGDGDFPIYGEKHNGRIVRVYVNVG